MSKPVLGMCSHNLHKFYTHTQAQLTLIRFPDPVQYSPRSRMLRTLNHCSCEPERSKGHFRDQSIKLIFFILTKSTYHRIISK